MTLPTYESVLRLVQAIPRAPDSGVRDVHWASHSHVVGLSRDTEGRVEIYLVGEELSPATAGVRAAIQFRTVHRVSGSPLEANQLVLPALGHFDQVAAFISIELLRNGADTDLRSAFRSSEPIIEIAIKRLQLSSQAMLGLTGELLLLEALTRRTSAAQLPEVIGSWLGWQKSTRDFSLGMVGVEVKTTTGPTSSHAVEGVHQVERVAASSDVLGERVLFLVSIGLQPVTRDDDSFSLPSLVSQISARLVNAGCPDAMIESFLANVKSYGADFGIGYDHSLHANDSAYANGFFVTFFRGFDMSDDAIHVLRRVDVLPHEHVDLGSVRFRVDLPASVAANNPLTGANQVADAVLREWLRSAG